MLESVLVKNISNGASMIFSYQEELNGIIVKDTSGLHPSEVTINYEGSSEGHRSENVLAPSTERISNSYSTLTSILMLIVFVNSSMRYFSGSSVELVFTKNGTPYTIYLELLSLVKLIFSQIVLMFFPLFFAIILILLLIAQLYLSIVLACVRITTYTRVMFLTD